MIHRPGLVRDFTIGWASCQCMLPCRPSSRHGSPFREREGQGSSHPLKDGDCFVGRDTNAANFGTYPDSTANATPRPLSRAWPTGQLELSWIQRRKQPDTIFDRAPLRPILRQITLAKPFATADAHALHHPGTAGLLCYAIPARACTGPQ